MVTDTAMGSSVVRSSGPGIVLSGWKGCEFAGLEVCCFFFGFFWIFCLGVEFWKVVGTGFENVVLGLTWLLFLGFF